MKRKPTTNASQRPPNPYSTLRASTIPNKKRLASRRACRTNVRYQKEA